MKAVLLISLIFLVIIILYFYSGDSDYEDYLYGMWTGDEEFCEKADTDNMMMFIGKREGGCRTAYLLIGPDVYNDTFTIKCGKAKKKFNATLEFSDDSLPIPEKVTMDIDIIRGTLRIYSGDTVYAVLYKNHEVTNSHIEQ